MKFLLATFLILASCAPEEKPGEEPKPQTVYVQKNAVSLLKQVRTNSAWTADEICSKAQKTFYSEHYDRYFFPEKWTFKDGKAFSCELVKEAGKLEPYCIEDGELSNGIGIWGSSEGMVYDLVYVNRNIRYRTRLDLYPTVAIIEGIGRLEATSPQDIESIQKILSVCSFQ